MKAPPRTPALPEPGHLWERQRDRRFRCVDCGTTAEHRKPHPYMPSAVAYRTPGHPIPLARPPECHPAARWVGLGPKVAEALARLAQKDGKAGPVLRVGGKGGVGEREARQLVKLHLAATFRQKGREVIVISSLGQKIVEASETVRVSAARNRDGSAVPCPSGP